jgi:hypothetical protein
MVKSRRQIENQGFNEAGTAAEAGTSVTTMPTASW